MAQRPSQRVTQMLANLHAEPAVAQHKYNRIHNWRLELPEDPAGFVDPVKDIMETTYQYHRTRIDMCVEYSQWALSELDRHEHQYRVVGYKYHRIPLKIRAQYAKLYPQVAHAKTVFEPTHNTHTDITRPHDQQCRTISSDAAEVLAIANYNPKQYPNLVDPHLKSVANKCEELLRYEEKRLKLLEESIQALENMISPMMKTYTGLYVDMRDLSNYEGMSLRQWICTFPEMQKKPGDVRTDIEAVVEMMHGSDGNWKAEALWSSCENGSKTGA